MMKRPRTGPGASKYHLFVAVPQTYAAALSLARRAERWSPPHFASFGWSAGTTFRPECTDALETMLRAAGWEPAPPLGAGTWWRHPKGGRTTTPFVVALRSTFLAMAGRTELPGVTELPGRPMSSEHRRSIDPRPAKVSAKTLAELTAKVTARAAGRSPPASPATTSARHAAAEQADRDPAPDVDELPDAPEHDPLNMRARVDRRVAWEARMGAKGTRKASTKGRKIPAAKA